MPAVNLLPPLALALDSQVVRATVWVGLVGLTIALLVLMRTRWGQSQPLRKCIVLSLLAHLLLGIYTTTVNLVSGAIGPGDGLPLRVSLVTTGPEDGQDASNTDPEPWQQLASTPNERLAHLVPSDLSPPVTVPPDVEGESPHRQASWDGELPAALGQVPLTAVHSPDRAVTKPAAAIEALPPARSDAKPHVTTEPPAATSGAAPDSVDAPPTRAATLDPPANLLDQLVPEMSENGSSPVGPRPSPAAIAGADASDNSAGSPQSTRPALGASSTGSELPAAGVGAAVGVGPNISSIGPAAANHDAAAADKIPSIYELRMAPDHTRQAVAHGGTRETEAAVVAALGWLAAHQSADGRWDGQRLEAGREAAIDGHERRGAGTRADTGITGLSLLALLASGHTHLQGEHRESVRRGLEFLLSVQAADGNLGGNATLYEKMYCHAMASFALSEAYAMTHDDRLQNAVRRAIGYTLAAQHGTTGGWRYQPGEAGDTSQLGWQFMALKSAELAGIPIPAQTRAGMIRYLNSVSSGKHGGLASYRPGHQVSRTMTAEALVCKQFLGMSRTDPAGSEAGNFLLEELPGQRESNFYYWYYATLGTYQLQDEHWQRWNKALQSALIGSQRLEGDKTGSWDPDPIWGAYGGRAYSTALGALCLEVYYRFLPFYVEAAGRNRQQK